MISMPPLTQTGISSVMSANQRMLTDWVLNNFLLECRYDTNNQHSYGEAEQSVFWFSEFNRLCLEPISDPVDARGTTSQQRLFINGSTNSVMLMNELWQQHLQQW